MCYCGQPMSPRALIPLLGLDAAETLVTGLMAALDGITEEINGRHALLFDLEAPDGLADDARGELLLRWADLLAHHILKRDFKTRREQGRRL